MHHQVVAGAPAGACGDVTAHIGVAVAAAAMAPDVALPWAVLSAEHCWYCESDRPTSLQTTSLAKQRLWEALLCRGFEMEGVQLQESEIW